MGISDHLRLPEENRKAERDKENNDWYLKEHQGQSDTLSSNYNHKSVSLNDMEEYASTISPELPPFEGDYTQTLNFKSTSVPTVRFHLES